MGMDVTLHCAMCGKVEEVEADDLKSSAPVSEIVDKADWKWQQNGDNFDIYCSEKCAA